MSHGTVRVRFAPAPTGMMHLGNIRTALMNALYAKRHNGTFILRIEDTDADRNYDPKAIQISEDLKWLGLHYQEGPLVGGSYGPYFQSERTKLYQEKLIELDDTGKIYRCFCTEEELERKRERQRALKLPPRYDRTCLHRSPEEIRNLLAQNTPFVWRLQIDHARIVTIHDLARKTVTFDMQHFSDFPLTRQDGSFTFLFANCVDDIAMKVTHVFRGEEHLSNTACQTALYEAFGKPLPVFWHMPLLCNPDGKKLSKRDFGFSLKDLREAGFLPQAILNYLAIIGSSYPNEIMDFDELARTIALDDTQATGKITYDVDKFHWVNRKWIEKLSPEALFDLCLPYLAPLMHGHTLPLPQPVCTQITAALQVIKSELNTLDKCAGLLDYIFLSPTNVGDKALEYMNEQELKAAASALEFNLDVLEKPAIITDVLKKVAADTKVPLKHIYWFIRLAITGRNTGASMHELIAIVGVDEAKKRVQKLLTLLL
jgi:nondiscriminating glutamyl-tRNA synthetase